jgi:hypothetical protein
MPKGEKLIGPKQKDHTTTHFLKKCFTKGEKLFKLQKPSTTKGRTFSRGVFI